jgi:hypothetical protein
MIAIRNPRLDNPMGRLPTAHASPRDIELIRGLALQHGMSFNEAYRQILALYLRQPFPLSSKRMGDSKTDRLPEMVAPRHIIEGIDVLASSLGHTRGEVLRQIIRGSLRKRHDRH